MGKRVSALLGVILIAVFILVMFGMWVEHIKGSDCTQEQTTANIELSR